MGHFFFLNYKTTISHFLMGNFGAPFPHFETQAFPMKKVEQVDWVRQPQLASDG